MMRSSKRQVAMWAVCMWADVARTVRNTYDDVGWARAPSKASRRYRLRGGAWPI